MSASTESRRCGSGPDGPGGETGGAGGDRRQSILAAAWRPAGLAYLACLLAAMAGGLWPEVLYPSHDALRPAPLPVLRALAVGQVGFFLLVYPLVLLRRADRGQVRRYWAEAAVESAGLMVVAVPFYVAAAYLADAVAADVVRVAVYVGCLMPLSWSAGAWFRSPRATSIVVLAVLAAALGLPAAYYISREFLAAEAGNWLWRLAPATFAWQLAGSRAGSWLPGPAWAVLLWPALAAAAVLARLLATGRSRMKSCAS